MLYIHCWCHQWPSCGTQCPEHPSQCGICPWCSQRFLCSAAGREKKATKEGINVPGAVPVKFLTSQEWYPGICCCLTTQHTQGYVAVWFPKSWRILGGCSCLQPVVISLRLVVKITEDFTQFPFRLRKKHPCITGVLSRIAQGPLLAEKSSLPSSRRKQEDHPRGEVLTCQRARMLLGSI